MCVVGVTVGKRQDFTQGFSSSRAWLEVTPRSARVIKNKHTVPGQTGHLQKQTDHGQGGEQNKELGFVESCSLGVQTHMQYFKSLRREETRNR